MNRTVTLLAVLLLAPHGLLQAAESADLVVKSANVITIDADHPRAQAFAVSNGKFTVIGSNEAVAGAIGPKTLVLDLAGKTITPGFIDAHAHPGPVYPEDRFTVKSKQRDHLMNRGVTEGFAVLGP